MRGAVLMRPAWECSLFVGGRKTVEVIGVSGFALVEETNFLKCALRCIMLQQAKTGLTGASARGSPPRRANTGLVGDPGPAAQGRNSCESLTLRHDSAALTRYGL